MFRSGAFLGVNGVGKEQNRSLREGGYFDFDLPIHVAGSIGYDDVPVQRGSDRDLDFLFASRSVT